MNKSVITFLFLFTLLIPATLHAEIVVLNDGKRIEGKIIEKNDNSFRFKKICLPVYRIKVWEQNMIGLNNEMVSLIIKKIEY